MLINRPVTINNSLVHGICNYNCITCHVNKPTYDGPKQYQPLNITERIIERIIEASFEGVNIRSLDNSGDGESTLHPEFEQRMILFGNMLRNWRNPKVKPPFVSVVTNGYNLSKKNILEVLAQNNINLRISFPTSVAAHYGEIMMKKPEQGQDLLSVVLPGIEKAMAMVAKHKLARLDFHVSPPRDPYIRSDFDETLDTLTRLAANVKLGVLNLEIFPALTNRGGNVAIKTPRVDKFPDLFNRYHKRVIRGVKVNLYLSYRRFFPRWQDYLDVLLSYRHPCLFWANLFLTSSGLSTCCNDQSVQEPIGSIEDCSIRELIRKREMTKLDLCRKCSHTPRKCLEYGLLKIYNQLSILKTGMFRDLQ